MIAFGLRFETERYVPHYKSPDEDWLRSDAVKYFDDDWARLPRAELAKIYEDARTDGHFVVVHVLSRTALRSLIGRLEGLELTTPGGAHWFRFDHVDEASPELAERMAHLGVRVCSNPAMLPEWHRADAFPLRTLLDGQVGLGFGSDYVGHHVPARPLSALSALQMAVTHGGYGTKECLRAPEALAAFTRGSAQAEGRDDKGVIRVGALGDLAGLSGDPTTVLPTSIAALDVLFTVVGGRVVYEGPPRAATDP
jgi:predicted amidohydrolase YtcJ